MSIHEINTHTPHGNFSKRKAGWRLIFLLCFVLSHADLAAQGYFEDGDISIYWSGTVRAEASPSWSDEGAIATIDVESITTGGVQIATSKKEWIRTTGYLNSIYT